MCRRGSRRVDFRAFNTVNASKKMEALKKLVGGQSSPHEGFDGCVATWLVS